MAITGKFKILLLLGLGTLLSSTAARSLKRRDEEKKKSSLWKDALSNSTTEKKTDNLDSLKEIFQRASVLRVFERFLLSSPVTPTLNEFSETPFTVFMPWDRAMEKLPSGWLDRLEHPMWALHLKGFILHHIHNGSLSLDRLKQTNSVTMLDGENLRVNREQVRPRVDDVRYLAYTAESDIRAFMMDEILVPSFMERTAMKVVPSSLASRWIKYAHMTGLDKFLDDSTKSFTVLVPSDEAFDQLDEETIALWESPTDGQSLRQVLLRHIVPETLVASDTMKQGTVTVEESLATDAPVIFQKSSDFLQVNTALVIQADIVAANGLVHVIDKVTMPSETEMQIRMDGTTRPIAE